MSKLSIYADLNVNGVKAGLKDCEKAAGSFKNSLTKLSNEDFSKLRNSLKDLFKKSTDFQSVLGSMTGNLGSFGGALRTIASVGGGAGMALAGIAGAAGLAAVALYKLTTSTMGYEKNLKQFQALTGVTSEELEKLSSDAVNLGAAFSMSGSQVVDSMKVVGSQLPHLLKDMDSLKSVTRDVLTLAVISEMETADAAKVLTTALNSFDLEANQATNVLNLMAALNKESAAGFNYQATVIEKAGSTAKGYGVNLNELASVTGVLASKISSADVAGTSLVNFIQEFSDEIAAAGGLIPALRELDSMSAEEINKKFGASAAKAARELKGQSERVRKLSEDIKGTNESQKQFQIVNDNLSATLDRLWNITEAYYTKLGLLIKPQIEAVTFLLNKFIDLSEWMLGIGENAEEAGNKVKAVNKEVKDMTSAPIERAESAWDRFNSTLGEMPKTLEEVNKQLADTEKLYKFALQAGSGWEHESIKALDEYNKRLKERQKLLREEEAKKNKGKKDVEPAPEGSIAYYQERINKNKKLFDLATTAEDRKKYENLIKADERLINSLLYNANSIKILQEKLTVLQRDYDAEKDDDERNKILESIKGINSAIQLKKASGIERDIIEYNRNKSILEKKKVFVDDGTVIDISKVSGFEGAIKEQQDELIKKFKGAYYYSKVVKDKDGQLIDYTTISRSLDEVNSLISTFEALISGQVEPISKELIDLLRNLKVQKRILEELGMTYDKELSELEDEKLYESAKRQRGRTDENTYRFYQLQVNKKQLENIKRGNNRLTKAEEISEGVFQKTRYQEITEQIKNLQEVIAMVELDFNAIKEEDPDGLDEYWLEAEKALKKYIATQKLLELEKTTLALSEYANAAQEVSHALSNFGNDAVTALGDVISTTADAIQKLWALYTATIATAGAEAIESGAKQPWPANLAAMASAAAAVISTVASIRAASKRFADGGIVQGASTIGDRNLVRVNSGEMILNNTQQARLFRMLDGERLQNSGSKGLSGNVSFRISGGDLVGVLNNYDKKYNKL